jgi:predicted phosphodiesterase
MKSIKIIHLGDLHYPENKDKMFGDVKDKAAPKSLIKSVTKNRLQLIMREIADLAERNDIRGLLISGDLTSLGNIDEYKECVEYLNNAIQVGSLTKWPKHTLHVVPGNHDVNRKFCDPKGEELLKKFDPLKDSWEKFRTDEILTVDTMRTTCISVEDNSVNLFSLNSCMGCGEKRYLPKDISDELEKILDAHDNAFPNSVSFSLLGEQLDTPVVTDDHLDALIKEINLIQDTSVPIVLAHHNLLSQAIPRVEIYTDILNSGLIRSKLSSCSRPIIYCHGHIHDDPIEQLVDLQYPGSKTVFISAPLLIDGFNIIEIEFARNKLPIGCKVHKYRVDNRSIISNNQVSISLTTPEMLPKFYDEKLNTLLKVCDNTPLRFEDVQKEMERILVETLDSELIRNVMIEAEWLSLIKISDREFDSKYWKIKRFEP